MRGRYAFTFLRKCLPMLLKIVYYLMFSLFLYNLNLEIQIELAL